MTALRDQNRARHAYACVAAVPERDFSDYKIAVNSFGAHVIKTGLCAAIAFLQRSKETGADLFLEHLDMAGIRGLPARADGKTASAFAQRVHAASGSDYMIATRDTLALVVWFRRAVQAIGGNADREGRS